MPHPAPVPPTFNPEWQTRLDGELAPPLRDRITTLLGASSKVSLASIAREVALSPTFVAGLMRDKAIRTRHMPRFNAVITRLEEQAGLRVNDAARPTAKLVDLLVEVAATLSAADRANLLHRLSE